MPVLQEYLRAKFGGAVAEKILGQRLMEKAIVLLGLFWL